MTKRYNTAFRKNTKLLDNKAVFGDSCILFFHSITFLLEEIDIYLLTLDKKNLNFN